MSSQEKNTVQLFFEAIAGKMGSNRKWESLNPIEQQQLIQAINVILSITRG